MAEGIIFVERDDTAEADAKCLAEHGQGSTQNRGWMQPLVMERAGDLVLPFV